MTENESTYKNRAEALRELKRRGFKIGKSKFYHDCSDPGKTKGLCLVESDGSITAKSLDRYVANPGSRLSAGRDPDEELGNEKARIEIQIKKHDERLKWLEIQKMEGLLIDKREADGRMELFVEAVKSALEVMCSLRSRTWQDIEDAAELAERVWSDIKTELRTIASYDRIEAQDNDGADTGSE